ncbi:hypothetical protein U3516DRAFT_551614 [Neocallimastix sp. 'constans']
MLGTKNTYYLVNKNNKNSIIKNNGINGNLYYCKEEKVPCNEINELGYIVIDINNVYTCALYGSEIKCSKGAISATECNENNIGKLFLLNEKINICLIYYGSNSFSIEINNANTGEYVVYKSDTSNNLFGTSNEKPYAIISINDKSILLNKKYSNGLKYTYVNKDGSSVSSMYKVMTKGDACPKTTGANPIINDASILELECTEGLCN